MVDSVGCHFCPLFESSVFSGERDLVSFFFFFLLPFPQLAAVLLPEAFTMRSASFDTCYSNPVRFMEEWPSNEPTFPLLVYP